MTERGRHYIFCRILAPPPPIPNTSPPQYATILNDREKERHYVNKILVPPMPTPSPTPQYLTILMTERGGSIIFCMILTPPPPPPDVTILNYLYQGEGGHIAISCI